MNDQLTHEEIARLRRLLEEDDIRKLRLHYSQLMDAGRIDDLAGIADSHGDGTLRLAPWQAVFLSGIDAAGLGSFLTAAGRAGFRTDIETRTICVTACSGSTPPMRSMAR